jgi:hypothetical protein
MIDSITQSLRPRIECIIITLRLTHCQCSWRGKPKRAIYWPPLKKRGWSNNSILKMSCGSHQQSRLSFVQIRPTIIIDQLTTVDLTLIGSTAECTARALNLAQAVGIEFKPSCSSNLERIACRSVNLARN